MKTNPWKRACLIVGLLVFVIYVVSYIWISARGRFEPGQIGLNGVKRYSWAPEGFVNEFKWNHHKMLFYYPLYYIDTELFHDSDEQYSGRFPINEVPKSEIGKVYRAWGL